MNSINLAIIGLGYVGLPLAIEFAKYRKVIGFDISKNRISELQQNKDNTLEISENDLLNLQNQQQIIFTNDVLDLQKYNINTFIITVPTPIDDYKRPDLQPLLSASEIVGKILKKNDIVIYESTVYPGATEEQCVPVLEHYSQLKFN
ncbi:MAG: Vi polysaccharide biosynthesis UDP-N-acetylglucosamine C-6 dehydrogenase TviB, partial [Rhodocyclaceae bacterium]